MEPGRQFARGYVRVELEEILSNPFARPLGWLIICGGAAVSAPVSWLLSNYLPWPAAAVLGLVIGLVYLMAALVPTLYLMEKRHYHRSTARWLVNDEAGIRGGYAVEKVGEWWLYAVFARPRGSGLGAELLGSICADADAAGRDLVLVAGNRRAARFYQRGGFRMVGRRLTGYLMRRTSPQSGC